MIISAIEQLLKAKTGIDAQITGIGSLQHFTHRRMDVLNIHDEAIYLDLLTRSDDELQLLVNLVTIPETWFFRDIQPFRYLQQYVESGWLAKNSSEQITILSLPCSTGEEPYSIAMALIDCGIPKQQIHIDAYDINEDSLAKAKKGLYRENSFRGTDLGFRGKYFSEVNSEYQIDKEIMDAVQFHHGNALDIYELVAGRLYDVIFCRNLLIYFDRDTQLVLLTQLDKMLLRNGRIFLGHAEATEVVMGLFEPAGSKGSFAYQSRCGDNSWKSLGEYAEAFPLVLSTNSKNKKLVAKKALGASSVVSQRKIRHTKPIDNSLVREIERKADNGELDEAARLCSLLVEQGTDDANALCLCGVINEVRGDLDKACELFEKSLLNDPYHYEAAVHLAETLDARGLLEDAKLMRARAKDIASKSDASS